MTKNNSPLAGIGLPICNEAAHIRRVLECWLAQDIHDFELVISDHASTNDTIVLDPKVGLSKTQLMELPSQLGMDLRPFFHPLSSIPASEDSEQACLAWQRTQPDWAWNNPKQAALDFVSAHPDLIIEEPAFPFNKSPLTKPVTHWPSRYIKRIG